MATANQTVPLGALFTPITRGLPPQYINVVVTLTGGLTFPGGAQIIRLFFSDETSFDPLSIVGSVGATSSYIASY